MTPDKRAFEALLDEYVQRYVEALDANDGVGTEEAEQARAAVLQAYDAARITADYWKAEHVAANVEIERLKNAGREGQPPAVAPVAEFNKAGGDLVADELVQSAYSWFREGWYARHKYTHPALKADAAAGERIGLVAASQMVAAFRAESERWNWRRNVGPKPFEVFRHSDPNVVSPVVLYAFHDQESCITTFRDMSLLASIKAAIAASPARVGEGEK